MTNEQKDNAEKLAKISEMIRQQLEAVILGGYEMSPEEKDAVQTLTRRAEALRWNTCQK